MGAIQIKFEKALGLLDNNPNNPLREKEKELKCQLLKAAGSVECTPSGDKAAVEKMYRQALEKLNSLIGDTRGVCLRGHFKSKAPFPKSRSGCEKEYHCLPIKIPASKSTQIASANYFLYMIAVEKILFQFFNGDGLKVEVQWKPEKMKFIEATLNFTKKSISGISVNPSSCSNQSIPNLKFRIGKGSKTKVISISFAELLARVQGKPHSVKAYEKDFPFFEKLPKALTIGDSGDKKTLTIRMKSSRPITLTHKNIKKILQQLASQKAINQTETLSILPQTPI